MQNDEGAPVNLGNHKFGKGDENDGSAKFYCGRKLGLQAIPGSDGQCGPHGGPQCASCKRFRHWGGREFGGVTSNFVLVMHVSPPN
jgi:hypothetical protein